MRKLQLVLALLIALSSALWAQNKSKQDLTIEQFEAKLTKAASNAQILDARTTEEYKLNHLKGAQNFSVANEAELQKQIDLLDKKKPVFVYSIGNGRSGVLAKKLKGDGFVEVYELPGGFSHWIGSGRPVVSTTGAGLTLADYNKLIKSDDKLVLVDVGSKFCGGCKRMLPVVDSLATENTEKLKLVKIEFFENKQLGIDLKVEALPTFILYKGDKIVWQKSGVFAKKLFEEELAKVELASGKQTANTLK